MVFVLFQIFDSVSQELAFFVDERLMKILKEMPDQDMARLIKIDKILGCLGLTSDEEIRKFVTFFIQKESGEDKSLATGKQKPDDSTFMVDLGDEFEGYDEELAAIFDDKDKTRVVPLTQFLSRFREFLVCQMTTETEEEQQVCWTNYLCSKWPSVLSCLLLYPVKMRVCLTVELVLNRDRRVLTVELVLYDSLE